MTGAGYYNGYSLRETAGAAAVVRIYDNTAASGTILDTVALAANESAREYYPSPGIRVENGLYFQVVSGTVEGSLREGF
jgi:hypothetical protein